MTLFSSMRATDNINIEELVLLGEMVNNGVNSFLSVIALGKKFKKNINTTSSTFSTYYMTMRKETPQFRKLKLIYSSFKKMVCIYIFLLFNKWYI